MEGSGSNNERVLGHYVRTRVPNSINPNLNTRELIKKRIEKHERRIAKNRNKNKNKQKKFPLVRQVRQVGGTVV